MKGKFAECLTRFIALDGPGGWGTLCHFDVRARSIRGGDTFLIFGVRGGPSKVVHLQFQAGGQTFENSLMLDPIQSFV